jgi:predicted aspartyl protease
MARYRFPPGEPNPVHLEKFGPRFEIEVGPPIIRKPSDLRFPSSTSAKSQAFSRMPALIDTGAGHTVLTPQAIERLGLPLVGYTTVSRLGGLEKVAAHVAVIQFPRYKLATIEVIEIVCCEIPGDLYQCLIGRDVLSRWIFTYDGRAGEWFVDEEDVAAWVDPPEGLT